MSCIETTPSNRIARRCRTAALTLALGALGACMGSIDAPGDTGAEAVSGPFSASRGDALLARVAPSGTHSISFWQERTGQLAVHESYDVDHDARSLIAGFRAGRDSYAALYQGLAGAQADGKVVARLRDAEALSVNRTTEDGTAAAPSTTEEPREKTVDEDWRWFQLQFCIPRARSARNPSWDHCDGSALTPQSGGQTQHYNLSASGRADVAVFNAADVGSPVTHTRIGPLSCSGACSSDVRDFYVGARRVDTVLKDFPTGWGITTTGDAFAVHYLLFGK